MQVKLSNDRWGYDNDTYSIEEFLDGLRKQAEVFGVEIIDSKVDEDEVKILVRDPETKVDEFGEEYLSDDEWEVVGEIVRLSKTLTIELAPGYSLEDYNDGNGGGLCCDLMIPGLPEGEDGDIGYVVDDRSRPYVSLLFDEEIPQEVVEQIEALDWVRSVYGSACPGSE